MTENRPVVLLDDRVNRDPEDARETTIIVEVTVRVLDFDGVDQAATTVYEMVYPDPREHLAEVAEKAGAEASFRAGAAMDAIAQETAWGR